MHVVCRFVRREDKEGTVIKCCIGDAVTLRPWWGNSFVSDESWRGCFKQAVWDAKEEFPAARRALHRCRFAVDR